MAAHIGSYNKVITVDHRYEMEERLSAVVAEAMVHALHTSKHGIVVTRHDQKTFSVRLSADITPGTTVERDLWRNNIGYLPDI
ncbi:hypothetical protein [Arthrobacter sp. NicSoilC5]|uniref:hypothetical protein n=1 Tax=Arthrobacter sp. NicSoilC5 TaxID=2831000 RepID=UPI001CC57D6A|nr:hypothetical protein [Arthrobacter sp. NicSoilC5]BCW78253.1 hypothetical protein NicSoilC5_02720 [Arthrobacter sp. NicSoilC5]